MKKTGIWYLVVCGLLSSCSPLSERERLGYLGKVKTVEEAWLFAEKDTSVWYRYFFSAEGQLTNIEFTMALAPDTSKGAYSYDDEGYMKASTLTLQDGTVYTTQYNKSRSGDTVVLKGYSDKKEPANTLYYLNYTLVKEEAVLSDTLTEITTVIYNEKRWPTEYQVHSFPQQTTKQREDVIVEYLSTDHEGNWTKAINYPKGLKADSRTKVRKINYY